MVMDDPSAQIQNLNLLTSTIRKETADIRDLLQVARKNADLDEYRDELQRAMRLWVVLNAGKSGVSQERDMLQSERECGVLDSESLKVKILEIKEREKMVTEEIEKVRVQRSRLLKRKDKVIEDLKWMTDCLNFRPKSAAEMSKEAKEQIKQIEREKEEMEKMNKDYELTIVVLESERNNLKKPLRSVCNEEALMRDRVCKLEGSLGAAVAKEKEMQMEKEEMEKNIGNLNERRDAVEKVLDMLQKELEQKRREVDEAIRLRDAIEQANARRKYGIEKLQREVDRWRDTKEEEELRMPCKEFELMNNKEVVSNANAKKLKGHIKLFAEEVDATRKAFQSKDEMVDDMKQQSEPLHKFMAVACKHKSLWALISSATIIFAAALASRGR